jgi:uncharacterized membrane protein YvbJ
MFCGSCGTQIKEGAKFCTDCGWAVPDQSAPVENPQSADKEEPVAKPQLKSDKIDKAIFWHLGNQIHACFLYKNDVVVGSMTDSLGAFIPDIKEFLEEKYKNIQVEMKEGE